MRYLGAHVSIAGGVETAVDRAVAELDHLATIIDGVEDKGRTGVCLDTCHLYAAGFDIRSAAGWHATMRALDRAVGISYLRAMHINDSLVPLGSRKDRHASLGRGRLGLSTFKTIVRDPRLRGVPMILETTKPDRWGAEIRLLRAYADPRRTRRPLERSPK